MNALTRTILGWLTSCWHWLLGALGWPNTIWNGLSHDGKVATVVALLFGLMSCIIAFLTFVVTRRAGSRVLHSRIVNRVEIVEQVAINEVVAFVSSKPHRSGKLENY